MSVREVVIGVRKLYRLGGLKKKNRHAGNDKN